ncbi:MAG TPA: M23 family metallopeptidase [Rhizomicrobium sp.]|nr:M23 family metallopeptidase [Rhizomicrobium sp.]
MDQFASDQQNNAHLSSGTGRIGAGLSSTEVRWALVSGSMAILVAGAIGWMAMGTLPVTGPRARPGHAALPYELFLKLVHSGGAGQLAAIAPQLRTPETAQDQAEANPTPGIETRTVTLDRGDTLAGAMEDAGVSASDANGAIAALGRDFNPRGLKTGMSFDITYEVAPVINATGQPAAAKTVIVKINGKPVVVPVEEDSGAGATPGASQPIARLLSLHFSPSIEQDITVTRDMSGSFSAQNVQKVLEVHHHRAGATIDSSLYLAGMQAGIPADIVIEMIRMFSYKVDFQRDLQPGDSFEVYYDYFYTKDGQPAKTGNISYARMRLGGKDVTLYRYASAGDDAAEYFDAKGQSAKGMLMKTPVDGARISSGFGSRFHPILGYTRMHKGVDFAVPTGTPVMAAGAGTISFMGWANGYGNFVVINHSNGYATAYGHLSRFAAGLRSGSHLSQGTVFAFSGMTGLATGPHLHYEIRVNGAQVNPLRVKIADGRLLTGKELRDFLGLRLKMDETLAAMPLETKVADNPTDLRQAKAK